MNEHAKNLLILQSRQLRMTQQHLVIGVEFLENFKLVKSYILGETSLPSTPRAVVMVQKTLKRKWRHNDPSMAIRPSPLQLEPVCFEMPVATGEGATKWEGGERLTSCESLAWIEPATPEVCVC